MRPTKHAQSGLAAPLNRLFRTEANVRVLRLLSLTGEALGISHIAERTSLDRSGVRRSVEYLADRGIVETVGTGKQRPVRLRERHPLAEALRTLFRAEASHAHEVMEELRRVSRGLSPAPKAVWMTSVDSADDLERIGIGVLASAPGLDRAADQLRSGLRETERKTDVLCEVRGYTLADLATLSAEQDEVLSTAVPLLGPPPESFLRPPGLSVRRLGSHAEADRRLLRLARAIGDRLAQDPTIAERAREYVQRYLRNAAPGERKEMEEWWGILEALSTPRLRRFLVDPGPRATRLRQSIPFVAVLTRAERDNLLREGEDDEEPA